MEKENIINIEFEDGDENFEIMGTFLSGKREYIALLPEIFTIDYKYGINDIFLCRYIQLEDGFEIEDIDDEEEKRRVNKDFEKVFNES